MRRFVAISLVGMCSAVIGCADPYGEAPAPGQSVAGELPAPRVRTPAPSFAQLPPTAEAAARRAAELTTTWTSHEAADGYAQLARFSVGEARRQAREAAARLPTDPQLQDTSSSGRVAAIIDRGRRGRRRELLVVTNETVRAAALVERRWQITLVVAEQRRRGWVIARWQPQP